MTIGHILLELRLSNKKSQKEIGEILNVMPQTIYKYENDISLPPIDKLKQLADYYNVTVDDILESNYNTSLKNNKDYIQIGNKIRDLRVKKEESLEEITTYLSNMKIKTTTLQLDRYERGIWKIPLHIIIALAKHFNTTCDEILCFNINNTTIKHAAKSDKKFSDLDPNTQAIVKNTLNEIMKDFLKNDN